MKFKDLKNAVCDETVLIKGSGEERLFVGLIKDMLITSSLRVNCFVIWEEHEISDWKIKPLEREKIALYKSIGTYGNEIFCCSEGEMPSFLTKKMVNSTYDNIRKRNILNPDKPTLYIDAETFEIIRD